MTSVVMKMKEQQLILIKLYSKSFSTILKAHIAAYQKYFNRVKLDLGNN